MTTKRSLATVLFTDIVGSTERAAELGDQAWRALLRKHHARVRRELYRFGGREVNTAGDGFVAVFDSPARGVRAASAIREALRELRLEIRAGLHAGEVEGEGRSLSGIAVHTGARVGAQAGPGEVLVSHTVRDLVAGAGFAFEDRGTHSLKGVPGEWRLYRVTSVPAGGAAPLPTRLRARVAAHPTAAGAAAAVIVLGLAGVYLWDTRGALGPGEALAGAGPGVAVLPFRLQGEGLDMWREGIVDLVSTNLDGTAGLRAIDSRTVLARWHEKAPDLKTADLETSLDVARQAGARYVLVGDAVALGPRVRLTADVYDVEDGDKLGRATVEGAPDSVFALVDRLSIDALRAILKRQSGDIGRVNLAHATTASLPALKAYLEGEVLFRRADFTGAVAAYERAIEADSTFALALLRLAAAYGWAENNFCVGGRGGRAVQADEETRLTDLGWQAIQRALRFVERLPEREALLVRSYRALYEGDLTGIEPLRLAVRRYPDDVELWYVLGELAFHLGEQALRPLQEVEQALARAAALDPRFSPAYIHRIHLALWAPDSARTASLLGTFERLVTPDNTWRRHFRLASDLAFGDAATQARAGAELDTITPGLLGLVSGNLSNPRFLETQAEVRAVWVRRAPDPAQARLGRRAALINMLNRGRVQTALDSLAAVGPDPQLHAEVAYWAHVRDLPVSAERLDRELLPAGIDSASAVTAFYVGAYAAEHGRWDVYGAARRRLQASAEHSRQVGDSPHARFADGAAQALEGLATWRRGRPEQALVLLRDGQRRATGYLYRDTVNATIRWWLGALLAETGRPREAEPYFASRPFDIPAILRLGRLYETLGAPEKAREQLAVVRRAWRNADPAVRSLLEGAGQGRGLRS
jgi:class 3 adenylate cyclase/TolB-like protein